MNPNSSFAQVAGLPVDFFDPSSKSRTLLDAMAAHVSEKDLLTSIEESGDNLTRIGASSLLLQTPIEGTSATSAARHVSCPKTCHEGAKFLTPLAHRCHLDALLWAVLGPDHLARRLQQQQQSVERAASQVGASTSSSSQQQPLPRWLPTAQLVRALLPFPRDLLPLLHAQQVQHARELHSRYRSMVQERQHSQGVPSLPSDPLLPLAYNTHVLLLSEASGSARLHTGPAALLTSATRCCSAREKEGACPRRPRWPPLTSCPGWTSPGFPQHGLPPWFRPWSRCSAANPVPQKGCCGCCLRPRTFLPSQQTS